MITASKEFKEKLNNGANIVNYADITLSDGMVLHLTYKDFMIGGCSIEDKTTDGKFGVGFVIGKTLSIKIANHDERFSQYDFYNSIIRIYVAMQMDNGTIEKIRKGVYYATVPSTRGEIIEISAVDGMFLLDQDYSTSSLAYPATLQAIITNACLECGIPIGFRQFDNMNFVVNEKPETGTYRQIVSYACQIAGYNARIDNDGYMQLIWYNSALLEQYNYVGGDFKTYSHDTILDGGNFKDYSTNDIISGGIFTDAMPEHIFRVKTLDVHTDNVRITGVRVVGEDDKTVLFGEEGYLIEVKNPFANGKEQEVANYLGGRMVGMMFRPFSAQILNNPLYEPFEVVRVSDWKGNVYISILNSVSYKVGGYTQVACQAEDPRRNGSMYYSEAAAAVVEARRNTQKQLSTYDKAVQQMNQIAINTLGYHVTYENQSDGGRITYLHDKPMLEDSTTIYKIGIDGFFVSQDGGQSYTAGFDKRGNAVVNILSAIGIQFDWAKGGTLSLGGENNVNGVIKIYDNTGVNVGVIDNNGIALYSRTNDIQIIMSPLIGFVQRDADGNEFYGLVYDKIVTGFPQYSQIVENTVYTGKDTDVINKEITDEKEEEYWYTEPFPELGIDGIKGLRTYRKYRYYYSHSSAYWSSKKTYPSGESILTVTLPNSFKGKKWIVRVSFEEIDSSQTFKYTRKNHYIYGDLPKCYEGYEARSVDWILYTDSMDTSSIIRPKEDDYEARNRLINMEKTNLTKYLSRPSPPIGETNAYVSGLNEPNVTLNYTYDENIGIITLRIKCISKSGHCVNELAKVRVYVVC